MVMSHPRMMDIICILLVALLNTLGSSSLKVGDTELVYHWASLGFDWQSVKSRDQSLTNGDFVPERNLVAGIKTYNGEVFSTIPPRKWNSVQPATLLKLVDVNGVTKLRPDPSWDAHTMQFSQSVVVDPSTGLVYVFNTGRTGLLRTGTPNNHCPATLVTIDLDTDSIVDRYVFPNSVVARTANFINDLVLNYVNHKARFVNITDTLEVKLNSLDLQTRESYAVDVESMKIKMPDETTSSLRHLATQPVVNSDVRHLGRKVSQSDEVVYYWDIQKNLTDQGQVDEGHADMAIYVRVAADDTTIMQWVDSNVMDATNSRVWRVFLNDTGNPDGVQARLEGSSGSEPNNGTLKNVSTNLVIIAVFFLISWLSAYGIYHNLQTD